ncbi:MAG: hypothetical protein IJG85_04330 [Eubacteriaceae bacterium]|nr:hypothetical protein [Eubacteriaceae bacterium]
MQWTANPVARLTVVKSGTVDKINFEGVSTKSEAGTPETFLDAANHLLNIAGWTAVLDGITRSVKEEAT